MSNGVEACLLSWRCVSFRSRVPPFAVMSLTPPRCARAISGSRVRPQHNQRSHLYSSSREPLLPSLCHHRLMPPPLHHDSTTTSPPPSHPQLFAPVPLPSVASSDSPHLLLPLRFRARDRTFQKQNQSFHARFFSWSMMVAM